MVISSFTFHNAFKQKNIKNVKSEKHKSSILEESHTEVSWGMSVKQEHICFCSNLEHIIQFNVRSITPKI